MKTGSRSRARLAVGGTIAALPIALLACACSSNSHAPAATASTTPTVSAAAAAQAAADQGTGNHGRVSVPKYDAHENVRKDIATTGCVQDGQQGWRLSGTATNASSSVQNYSIVVDFVTPVGDTVIDTKVLHVGPVSPKATADWSATGAVGASKIVCVIRQALAS